MPRYTGQPLPDRPRVAVVGNDALGNFVVLTPLFQALRAERGAIVHYFGGGRVQELASESDLLEQAFPLFGSSPREAARVALQHDFDLVVNVEVHPWAKALAAVLGGEDTPVCGPALNHDGRGDMPFADDERGKLWEDKEWIAADLTERYPFLRSGFIADLFVRLAYLEGPLPAYRLPQRAPSIPVPDVLLATAASLPEKLWPTDRWTALVGALNAEGLTVGLLGAPPAAQAKFWKGADEETKIVESGVEDLRGRFTLPEVVGAIAQCRLVVTLDNGILHLAAATPTPTVGLFRFGIHRLWAPPVASVAVLTPGDEGVVAEIPLERVVAEARARLKT